VLYSTRAASKIERVAASTTDESHQERNAAMRLSQLDARLREPHYCCSRSTFGRCVASERSQSDQRCGP